MNYRLRVKFRERWVWGLHAYTKIEEAEARKVQMEAAGHKVIIEVEAHLFN